MPRVRPAPRPASAVCSQQLLADLVVTVDIRAVQAELTAGVPLQLGGVEMRNLDPAITESDRGLRTRMFP